MNREVIPKMPPFGVTDITPPDEKKEEEERVYRPPQGVDLVIRAELPVDEWCNEYAEGEVGRFVKLRFEYGALTGMDRDGKWHRIGQFYRDAIVGDLMEEKTRSGNPGQFTIELGAS